jgi:gluconate 5-dehydrogenase
MTLSMFDLSGRTAFISGSSRGIGFTVAEALAGAGARVILNSRSAGAVSKACDELAAKGFDVHGMPFDVTDRQAVADAFDRMEAEIGPIDIAVNNAGIQRRSPFVDITEDDWRAVMTTNLDAVFFVGQAAARKMIPRGRGKIINICSLASEVGRATIGAYTTAKGAVKMLTKSMCIELAKDGIQVNGIGPGYFRTDLNTDLFNNQEFNAWVRGRTPAGRWGELEELKGAAIFLASDASSFVNGQVLYIDGGLLSTI